MSDATIAGAARAWISERESEGTSAAAPESVTTWHLPDTRRALQLALAAIWLLDAVLQMQPFMFSSAFGRTMLASSAVGNPGSVARAIVWSSRQIGLHAGFANAVFCVIQIAIALGIAVRPTVKAALAASVVWSAGVWWIGEGLGGILSGQATPVTGAPGAVLVYGLLAVILWPRDRHPAGTAVPFVAARAVGAGPARLVWLVFWGVMAALSLETVDLTPFGLSQKISAMATGEPRWLAVVVQHGAGLVSGNGAFVSVFLAIVFTLVALSTYAPATLARGAIVAVIALALVIWIVGESLGGILSGASTDPNSGLLLVLLALAYWPAAGHGAALVAPDADEAVS